MAPLDDRKSFKDWLQDSYEKKEPLTEEAKDTGKETKKEDVEKPASEEKMHDQVAQPKKEPQSKQEAESTQKASFEEFQPVWRKKSIAEMDKAAKSKNSTRSIQSYLLAALLLVGISIGSYILWENLITNRINTIDADPQDLINIIKGKKDDDSGDSSKTEKELTFYVLEIGVSGSREVSVDEIETSCGDVLVPVKITKVFNSKDPSELSVLEAALTEIFENVGEVYDEERNLVNDVANSGLTLERVSKIVDQYEVDLSGNLVTTGVCNTERIKEQIEETAKINLGEVEIVFKLDGNSLTYVREMSE